VTDSSDCLTGVLSVLCTPFTRTGDIDTASLERLVAHQLAWKVDGIVVFGLAGELYKLTDHDRRRILQTVVNCVDGAVPVIAGTEHTGTEGAVTRTREAVELGASAVMVYPPTFIKPDAAGVVDYFASIGRSVSVPVIVQDAPAWTGVPLPVELLARLCDAAPNVAVVKVEAPPAADKIRSLREAGLSVIGGFGALHLLEDLDAGVQALMPGSAMPGMYKEWWDAHTAGDLQRLWGGFTRALPLLSFQMSSLDTFVAVQKRLLHRIGILDCDVLRRPGAQLSADQTRWLDELLEYTDTNRYLGTPGGSSAESLVAASFSTDSDSPARARPPP
jgi:4-hydroxy-tetrahydrodipicolinate synthase